MSKSPDISEEDKALFRDAIGDAKPLKHNNVIPDAPKPKPRPLKTEEDNQAVIDQMGSGEFDESTLERGDELLFHKPGVQKQVLKKLRQGKFKIEAELDLHGLTVEPARDSLSGFLKNCNAQGKRCVRIIHGKGLGSKNKQPVIKNKLNNWLKKREDVLAYCSARNVDGGTGAIYLLLRKN